MNQDLPLRHRAVLAALFFLMALVAGTWGSTLVGDDDPTVAGVALGGLAGLVLAAVILSRGRAAVPGPPSGPVAH